MPFATVHIETSRDGEALYRPPSAEDGAFCIGHFFVRPKEFAKTSCARDLRRLWEAEGTPKDASEDGLDAALRVMAVLLERIPQGNPPLEFTDIRFDPVFAASVFVRGRAPGHCTVRSSLSAAILIAWGHAARVVSFTQADATGGHTGLEVWSAREQRWVYVDSNDLLLVRRDHEYANVLDFWKRGSAAWRLADMTRGGETASWPPRLSLLSGDPTQPAAAHVFYPEPWLYLRAVDKVPGLRRGTWLHWSADGQRVGHAQGWLRVAVVVSALTALLGTVVSIAR